MWINPSQCMSVCICIRMCVHIFYVCDHECLYVCVFLYICMYMYSCICKKKMQSHSSFLLGIDKSCEERTGRMEGWEDEGFPDMVCVFQAAWLRGTLPVSGWKNTKSRVLSRCRGRMQSEVGVAEEQPKVCGNMAEEVSDRQGAKSKDKRGGHQPVLVLLPTYQLCRFLSTEVT